MKNVWIYLSLAITSVTLAVACGKKDDGKSSDTGTAATPTSCQAGYLYDSSLGCLPQGSCVAGSAMYNNQCMVVRVGNINQNCTAGQVYSTSRNTCLSQGSCGFGYALYNNQCEYTGNNNNVNYQNNQYNGYQYQNGYFYPQYPNYNSYYNGGYNPYYQGNYGYGLRGGIWLRYY